MFYYIDKERQNSSTAGSKAPKDIAKICDGMGMKRLELSYGYSQRNHLKSITHLLNQLRSWKKIRQTIMIEDVVLLQHPLRTERNLKALLANFLINHEIKRLKRKGKLIAVIHDLDSIRHGFNFSGKLIKKLCGYYADMALLRNFDSVICHNEHMKQYLINKGFPADRIVSLEIFDYLCENHNEYTGKRKKPTIVIAGSLAIDKCAYIYDIFGIDKVLNKNLRVNLYGAFYTEKSVLGDMVYKGSFMPDELPSKLDGDFGLVWDGNSIETCAGNTGEYLKYNNPHKVSLYLASGIPVIVWKYAAIADFIQENKVGIVVENLCRLDEIISDISEEEYLQMCKNANEIGNKLRSGEFFKAAFAKSLKIIA